MQFRLNIVYIVGAIAATLWVSPVTSKGETRRPLTPEACTAIRYLRPQTFTSLLPLKLSPDRRSIAYIVQVPDEAANDNKDQLYARSVDRESSEETAPLLASDLIVAVDWFPDNRHLAVLVRQNGKVILAQVDSSTKGMEIIWSAHGDITDYSMDDRADTIVVAARVQDGSPTNSPMPRDDRRGYRINLDSVTRPEAPKREVYVLRKADEHHWTASRRLSFASPLSGKLVDAVEDAHDMHINLSPNGRYLLIDNVEPLADISPQGDWASSPVVQWMRKRGIGSLIVSYLYDLETHEVSIPLKSPITWDTVWAPDSKSFAKVALAPVGSDWEASDLAKGAPNDHSTHLFTVDVLTGKVSEVLNRAEKPPVDWLVDGDLIVRIPDGNLETYRKIAGQWTLVRTNRIPFADAAPYSPTTANGHLIAMEYESSSIPPELVAFDVSANRWWTIARLNPQADDLMLPRSQIIFWTTSTGFKAKGMLLLPPDYDPHRRYPLVIEEGSILYSGEFVCDSGASHVSSFARGILADAGIVYLMRFWPGSDEWENSYYPKGYPGYLAEAAFKLDLTESAIKYLDQLGVVEPSKIGLIGFSRGGWYVEYALSHSRIHFGAATATDNVQYSVGEYWAWNSKGLSLNLEGMYGGPPYGPSLKNWLDFSISFNLDKIRTPLLMEVMGYGTKYEDPNRPPIYLTGHDEVFAGLSNLNKPVELYYYPDEQHQPDHPQARIASLQRNVDWFRFWLQGYKRASPEDPEQYKRWESMQASQSRLLGSEDPRFGESPFSHDKSARALK